MALEARVKPEYYLHTVIAFSGHEYFKNEWRPVPVYAEEAARAHEQLEVREAQETAVIKVQIVEDDEKPKRRTRSRKIADEGEG